VDPQWRGQRARRCAHRSLASGRSGARKLAVGGTTERGKRGELGSGLTGARAALMRPGHGGAERGGGGKTRFHLSTAQDKVKKIHKKLHEVSRDRKIWLH
jgi:hypothetical protein